MLVGPVIAFELDAAVNKFVRYKLEPAAHSFKNYEDCPKFDHVDTFVHENIKDYGVTRVGIGKQVSYLSQEGQHVYPRDCIRSCRFKLERSALGN